MAKEFSTVDITRLTSREKIMELVDEGARPGEMCETSPGYIHEGEVHEIAEKIGVSLEELKNNFLRQVKAYNSTLHKPKHETHEKRLGSVGTEPIQKMPYGKCIFLDKSRPEEHKCLLGEKMPLHCKISTNKEFGDKLHAWYMLNHAVRRDDPRSLREWSIYLMTHPTIPGGRLEELVPDEAEIERVLSAKDLEISVVGNDNNTDGGGSNGKDDRNRFGNH